MDFLHNAGKINFLQHRTNMPSMVEKGEQEKANDYSIKMVLHKCIQGIQ